MKRLSVVLWAIFLVALSVSILYSLFGHTLIQAVYEGRSLPFFNAMIEGQKNFPLEVYLETAGGMMWSFLLICFFVFVAAAVVIFEPPSQDRWRWNLARILTLLMVSILLFRPYLLENELVYLIHPKRIFNPSFLSSDWTWNRGVYTHLVYDWLISPFTLFLSNLKLVILGRLFFWILALETLLRLTKMWGLKWWQFTLGIAYYLYADQTLAATEALFSGLEAKCFAYLFLLLALHARFKNEFNQTAVFSGLAISFHALVGTWGSAAILATLIAAREELSLKKAGQIFALFLLCAAPGFATTVIYLSKSGQFPQDLLAQEIFFRAPHHLDPRFFLTPMKAVEITLYYALTLFLIWRSLKREHALILSIFISTLMGVFVGGLIAREMNWLAFLYRYPFRVGPVFLLLLFSFAAFRSLELPKVKWLAVFFLLFQFARHEMPLSLVKTSGDFLTSWRKYFQKTAENDFLKAAHWIKHHTPEESIFVAPPWEYGFWIHTERAQVVSYKYLFVDKTMEEWLTRLKDLNGGFEFEKRGSGALGEMKMHYPRLTKEQLQQIKARYDASYYFTTMERNDLAGRLVYSNPTYFLYRLGDEAR